MSVYEEAARVIENADAIVVGAGAGIGVDSGLPDFRGDRGFWNAYPPFKERGLSFVDLANPRWFEDDPSLAWGFYGHRLHLYRETEPHVGFNLLRTWIDDAPSRGFVFTSNVDGQFQKANFRADEIVECHGSIHHSQCLVGCDENIWEEQRTVTVSDQFRAEDPLPTCLACSRVARPNILMFGDFAWLGDRTEEQYHRFSGFVSEVAELSIAIIEIGAGQAVPTVRYQCERLQTLPNATLIRINPRESHGPAGTIEISEGAVSALENITKHFESK